MLVLLAEFFDSLAVWQFGIRHLIDELGPFLLKALVRLFQIRYELDELLLMAGLFLGILRLLPVLLLLHVLVECRHELVAKIIVLVKRLLVLTSFG